MPSNIHLPIAHYKWTELETQTTINVPSTRSTECRFNYVSHRKTCKIKCTKCVCVWVGVYSALMSAIDVTPNSQWIIKNYLFTAQYRPIVSATSCRTAFYLSYHLRHTIVKHPTQFRATSFLQNRWYQFHNRINYVLIIYLYLLLVAITFHTVAHLHRSDLIASGRINIPKICAVEMAALLKIKAH